MPVLSHSSHPGLLSQLAEVARRVSRSRAAHVAERQRQRTIGRELNGYSDRELGELGLSRLDIPLVARGEFR